MLRGAYNIFITFFFIMIVLLYGLMLDLIVKDESKKINLRVGFLHRLTRIGTKLIGIRIKGRKKSQFENSFFIVSNHLSYLDIVVIASLYRAVFVSTTEVESSGLFGRLSTYGGAIFIDRKNRTKVKEDSEKIRKILERDNNLVIFLEGTTSNGDGVLPFKSSFLEVVFKTKKPVFGLCIKYTKLNSEPINQDNRDLVYYYADHSLLPHILKFLYNLKSLEVEVREVGVFSPESYPSRKELASDLYEKISKAYAL